MIDDKLANGMVKRYMRELAVDTALLRATMERLGEVPAATCESAMRTVDRLIDERFSTYVISKLLVLDKKRSSVEALLILPAGHETNVRTGAFITAMLRVNCRDGPKLTAMGVRASFHWLMRVFKRRGEYDPRYVRHEMRAALVGLSAMGDHAFDYEEVPSVEGASVVRVKDAMVETITYITDAQASTEQSSRWRRRRDEIATTLGFSDWSEVGELTRRINWIGMRRGRAIEVKPRTPWTLQNGASVRSRDYRFDSIFIGVSGASSAP